MRPYDEGWKPTTAVMGADGVVRTPEELGDEPFMNEDDPFGLNKKTSESDPFYA